MNELVQNPSIFETKRYFEWIAGVDKGVLEVYVAELNDFVWFESGRNCNKIDLSSMLVEISEQDYLLRKDVMIQKPMNDFIIQDNTINQQNTVEKNPVRIILDKQKKLDDFELQYPVTIKIPSLKIIEFLLMMFDEDEVFDEITKLSIDSIDNNFLEDFKKYIISYIKDNYFSKLNDVK